MHPLITPAAMRNMERRYFQETGVQSIELMETAARALCDFILARYGTGALIGFACGPGGNGGDGYACARMFVEAGGRAFCASPKPPATPDAIANHHRAVAAGVGADAGARPDVWVDALYGTGLSRAPEGASARLIERINADRAQGSAVVAVDIPSGLNGATGEAYAPCVTADATCAFQYAKPGCYLGDGLDAAGTLTVADIGIPADLYPGDSPALVTEAEVRAALPKRPRNFHKGNAGHLLIVAGSFGMAGAAAMCAMSAVRTGAGLVTVACPGSIVPILQTLVPPAMCVPLPESDGAIGADAVPVIASLCEGKTAAVCGCGLSRRAHPGAVAAVLDSGLPALLDADGLNLIAEHDALRGRLRENHVVTPHPGEAARLLGHRVTDPIGDALALRRLGCQALLKGAASVIPAGERALISTSGASGMARGGSGDCLSGVIGALMAQHGRDVTGDALALLAAAGSELHGLAGEAACAKKGVRGMTPLDLIDALPEVLMRYE